MVHGTPAYLITKNKNKNIVLRPRRPFVRKSPEKPIYAVLTPCEQNVFQNKKYSVVGQLYFVKCP